MYAVSSHKRSCDQPRSTSLGKSSSQASIEAASWSQSLCLGAGARELERKDSVPQRVAAHKRTLASWCSSACMGDVHEHEIHKQQGASSGFACTPALGLRRTPEQSATACMRSFQVRAVIEQSALLLGCDSCHRRLTSCAPAPSNPPLRTLLTGCPFWRLLPLSPVQVPVSLPQ